MVLAAEQLETWRQLSPEQLRWAARAELAERRLAWFIRGAWHVHHQDTPLRWNWHIDAIAEHLEAVTNGEINRLIINMPPGAMKSLSVSVYWPAWEWIRRPSRQYLAISSDRDLALRDALRCHQVVESSWYQNSFFPEWSFSKSQDAKSYYTNTAGGLRQSRSTGQKITGKRADRIIIDDPLDASDAHNDKKPLAEHVRWYRGSLYNRTNDPDKDPIVLMMQRLHEIDLAGVLLGEGGWVHLLLPNEFDPSRRRTTVLGFRDPREKEGELLFPERITPKVTAEAKATLGPVGYAGQYQQAPAPAEGAIFKKAWFRFWVKELGIGPEVESAEQLPEEFDYLIGSFDCTWKKSKDSDYVVGQVWGVKGACLYLLDQVRKKADLVGTIDLVRQVFLTHPGMRTVLIEAKANGPDVIAALRREIPGIQEYNPQGESKEERAQATLPRFAAEQVFFPHPDQHQWVRDVFLPEVQTFPNAAHDDQVDTMTQAINWVSNNSIMPEVFTLGGGN